MAKKARLEEGHQPALCLNEGERGSLQKASRRVRSLFSLELARPTHGMHNELTRSELVEKDVSFEGKEAPTSQQGDVHDKDRRFLGDHPDLTVVCPLTPSWFGEAVLLTTHFPVPSVPMPVSHGHCG